MMCEDKRGQGLAWYGIRGPRARGGEKPSSPRSRASFNRATLRLADPTGGFVERMSECVHHSQYMASQYGLINKAAARSPSAGPWEPEGGRKKEQGPTSPGRTLAPISSRFDQSGCRVVTSKDESCPRPRPRPRPRHAVSINLGFAHGLDGQTAERDHLPTVVQVLTGSPGAKSPAHWPLPCPGSGGGRPHPCVRLDKVFNFWLVTVSEPACALPQRWYPKVLPDLGFCEHLGWYCTLYNQLHISLMSEAGRVESTGPINGRTRASSLRRATRLGLRREDESRMPPLQRLRRPWGTQEGNARGHKEERRLCFLPRRGKDWARFAAQSLPAGGRGGNALVTWNHSLSPAHVPALFPHFPPSDVSNRSPSAKSGIELSVSESVFHVPRHHRKQHSQQCCLLMARHADSRPQPALPRPRWHSELPVQ